MSRIVICADDFGLKGSVNEGILSLVELGRINAISCMSVGEHFDTSVMDAQRATDASPIVVEIGLHLTFTQYSSITKPLHLEKAHGLPEISQLLIDSHLRLLKRDEIENEVHAQFDRFIEVFGRKPDFVDGHQHAHLLPVIRDAVIAVAKQKLATNGWIRNCHQPMRHILQSRISLPRSLLISHLSKPLRRKAQKAEISTNALFLGINNFDPREDFGKLMNEWLQRAARFQGSTLIMCHPGLKPNDHEATYDPISGRREDEYEYLASTEFAETLKKLNLTLAR